jgi:OmpA-OmpF porin, OOP family
MGDFVTTVLLEKAVSPVAPPVLGVFKDIKFEVDKDVLMASSFATLDEIVNILKQNPDISVEIQGHTDSTASEAYNMDLSKRRAMAVMKYLESMGIAASRMTAKGYGEGTPIDTNDKPEGKANICRVELKPMN